MECSWTFVATIERPTVADAMTRIAPSFTSLSSAFVVLLMANHLRGVGRRSKTWLVVRYGAPCCGDTSTCLILGGAEARAISSNRTHPVGFASIARLTP